MQIRNVEISFRKEEKNALFEIFSHIKDDTEFPNRYNIFNMLAWADYKPFDLIRYKNSTRTFIFTYSPGYIEVFKYYLDKDFESNNIATIEESKELCNNMIEIYNKLWGGF